MKMLQKHCYRLLGCFSLGLGLLGVFLPLLPTTCFVLLAAWAFSKSSPRFYQALCSHKYFGSTIRDWQEHRAMSIKAKVLASVSIIFSFSLTALLVKMSMPLFVILVTIMMLLLISVALIKTKLVHPIYLSD